MTGRIPEGVGLPAGVRGARLGVSRGVVLAFVVLVSLAVVVFAARVAAARDASSPEAISPSSALQRPTSAPSSPGLPAADDSGNLGAGAGGTASSAGATPVAVTGAPSVGPAATSLVVHVVGQVHRPGLVSLSRGSRVADALESAGGATETASLERVNLARVVGDGEQIWIPAPGETPPAPVGAAPGDPGTPGAGPQGPSRPLNLNAADAAALQDLPGIGPVLSERIVQWRSEHGRFAAVDELGEISGIGEKLLAQLRPLVAV